MVDERRVFKFTNCGSAGRYGPTQSFVQNEYKNTNLEGKVVVDEGVQNWTVPKAGIYRITTFGAAGGSASGDRNPGHGAVISGHFYLSKDQLLKILVGQKGESGGYTSPGGGGGTFVTYKNNYPIIIAGGGGGTSDGHRNTGGRNGSMSTSGTRNVRNDSSPGPGHNGKAGEWSGSSSLGEGGAGFLEDAERSAKAFINGGIGGTRRNSSGQHGGFGSGGAGGSTNGGAGGGGYSGGAGGNSCDGAGGGGSFISTEALRAATSNGAWSITGNEPHPVYSGEVSSLDKWNNDHGKVIVELISKHQQTSLFISHDYYNIKKYNSFTYNLLKNQENNLNLKAALFSKEFNFNSSDKIISDIELSKEIKTEKYKRKKVKNIEIINNGEEIILSGDNVSWKDEEMTARYAVFYNDNNKGLLFCVDFNAVKKANSKGIFRVKWRDQQVLSFSEIQNKNLNLDFLNWIDGKEYSKENSISLLLREFNKVKENNLFYSALTNYPKFVELILKNENILNQINTKLFIKSLIEERIKFNSRLSKFDNLSILDYIISDSKMVLYLLQYTDFINFAIEEKNLIVKNCKEKSLIKILKGIIDFSNNYKVISKINENYEFIIQKDQYLKTLYNDKISRLK